jgi:hypothetical protein
MSHTVHSQAKTTPLIRKEIKESKNQGINQEIELIRQKTSRSIQYYYSFNLMIFNK